MPAGSARAVRSGADALTASTVARLKCTDVGPISPLTARAATRMRASSARAAAKNTARLSAAVGARSTGGSAGRGSGCGVSTGAVLTVPGVGARGGSAVPAGEPALPVHPAAKAATATASTTTAVEKGRKRLCMTAPHGSGACRTADNRGDARGRTKVVRRPEAAGWGGETATATGPSGAASGVAGPGRRSLHLVRPAVGRAGRRDHGASGAAGEGRPVLAGERGRRLRPLQPGAGSPQPGRVGGRMRAPWLAGRPGAAAAWSAVAAGGDRYPRRSAARAPLPGLPATPARPGAAV